VYGKSEHLPYSEEHDLLLGSTTVGRWAYACSKMLDEFLALAYWKERKQPAVVLRLFNTVGPRQTGRYGMVIPTFVRQALAEQNITVYGDGTQQRCFCHVYDVIRALVAVMEHEEAYGEVYNVGATNEITIRDLAERVREMTESESEIQLISYEDAFESNFEDMARRVPDVTKIGELIGWQAEHSLDEILTDVIEFQRASALV
jgi:UDP-glucose 4-epimerase